jgi:hypothetical protein
MLQFHPRQAFDISTELGDDRLLLVSKVELVMRTKRPSQHFHAAPRYERVAAEDAARLAAQQGRMAEGARTQAARFFHDLRQHLRLARGAVAVRVGTEPSVIEALETGKMGGLPQWPETMRIVQAYTALVRMDPRPVLHVLHLAFSQHHKQQAERSLAERFHDAWQTGSLAERLANSLRVVRVSGLKWAAALALPTVLVASLMLSSGPQASSPLASMLGLAADGAVTTTRRDGFTWIDARDPRERRGDKLQGPLR